MSQKGCCPVAQFLLQAAHFFRAQVIIFLTAITIPVISNVIYLTGLSPWPHLKLTPTAFAVSGLVMALGVFWFHISDIVPVARTAAVDSLAGPLRCVGRHTGRRIRGSIPDRTGHDLGCRGRGGCAGADRAVAREGRPPCVVRHQRRAGLGDRGGDTVIDLLITDVVMPGMNGRDLATQLTAQRPNLAVLYMTGYPLDVELQQGVERDGTTLLQKPFTPDRLRDSVEAILQRQTDARAARA